VRRTGRPAARYQDSGGQRDDRHGCACLCRGAAAGPVKLEAIMHGKTSGIEGIKDPVHRIRRLFLGASALIATRQKKMRCPV
jgi:hypothetical protein